ncbi:MAG: S8 family serine peptidase, partial [Bacteroidales bacterium]|nr:S8 family serine peptidase [Bacteroidales bacterium]
LPILLMAQNALTVDFRSERHRTEWNWVEYRVSLKNTGTSPITNPIIRYFAENTNVLYCENHANDVRCSGLNAGHYGTDSVLSATVDYSTHPFHASPEIKTAGKYTVIDLKTSGTLRPGKKLEVNFRLYRKDWAAWDCSRDFSYQKNPSVKEKNIYMSVYDGSYNSLWGYDPVNGVNRTDNMVWTSRGDRKIVGEFDGNDSSAVPAGRFWILKDSVLSMSEKDSLEANGVRIFEVSRYQGKNLILGRTSSPVNVKSLQQRLSGFYNAFAADDTTSLTLALGPNDLYEKKLVCGADGSCQETVEERLSYKVEVTCWPDVTLFGCKNIVKSCGASDVLIDRNVVLATVPRGNVSCLSGNRNVRNLKAEKKGEPVDAEKVSLEDVSTFNDAIYEAMNLKSLQNTPGWQAALTQNVKTTTWLNGEEYTGEGIIVGVYDTGIDFENPAFQEYDAEKGEYVRRVSPWYKDEKRTYDYEATTVGRNDHGSRVAGTIGGNGNGSPNSVFRGIAPKVKFYSWGGGYSHMYGHVTNHSYVLPEDDLTCCFDPLKYGSEYRATYYYGKNIRAVDEEIFKNWKSFTDDGDYLTKTTVVGAANNGDNDQHGPMVGYHSILNPFKNTITVGAINVPTNRVANFSSLGPTWDGRIKPDVMANGDANTSIAATTVGNGMIASYDYDYFCGTSAASPFVTGVVALMYQKFKEKTGLSLDLLSMRNSTTKALLIHSAIDMVGIHDVRYENFDIFATEYFATEYLTATDPLFAPYGMGPDFVTGWGRIDAAGALGIIENYDAATRRFDRFREFGIYNGAKKRWSFNVPSGTKKTRVTLAWDDAVPSIEDVAVEHFTDSKLVNDLDIYLVSPSGVRHYPWKLDPLPTDALDEDGRLTGINGLLTRTSGLERITLEDAEKGAYKTCKSSDFRSCFDHLNNVEVVDVEGATEGADIEAGEWQVVVEGYRVTTGNSEDGFAQVASIVSDFKLEESCMNIHPYLRNSASYCSYDLGDNLENYVTFDTRTDVSNDLIFLYDGKDQLIGAYTGSQLSGKKVTVRTRMLKVVLESNDDNQQGWGYGITKIEHLPYAAVVPMLHEPTK